MNWLKIWCPVFTNLDVIWTSRYIISIINHLDYFTDNQWDLIDEYLERFSRTLKQWRRDNRKCGNVTRWLIIFGVLRVISLVHCEQEGNLKEDLNIKQVSCYVFTFSYIIISVSHHFMYVVHQSIDSCYEMFHAIRF